MYNIKILKPRLLFEGNRTILLTSYHTTQISCQRITYCTRCCAILGFFVPVRDSESHPLIKYRNVKSQYLNMSRYCSIDINQPCSWMDKKENHYWYIIYQWAKFHCFVSLPEDKSNDSMIISEVWRSFQELKSPQTCLLRCPTCGSGLYLALGWALWRLVSLGLPNTQMRVFVWKKKMHLSN